MALIPRPWTAEALKRAGASIVDNVDSPGLLQLVLAANYNGETEDATDLYLAQLKNPPFTTWASIVVDPRITPSRQSIKNNLGQHPKTDPKFAEAMRVRNELRDLILQLMAENQLDGLIYAPFDRAPPKLPAQTSGSNRLMSTFIGFPSIVVPAGLNSEGLPIGVEIMSRPWTEALLLRTAYAYDKLAKQRVVPSTVPAL
jgi:amidase